MFVGEMFGVTDGAEGRYGGMAGKVLNDVYQEELDEFMRWMKRRSMR